MVNIDDATIEKIVKNYHAKYSTLYVNRHNKAINFCKSQEYGIIKIEDIDIGNGYFMNDNEMEKNII